LSNDISIVKELPSDYSWSTREYYATGIRATRIKTAPVHASASWYLENVLPVMQRYYWNINLFFEIYTELLTKYSCRFTWNMSYFWKVLFFTRHDGHIWCKWLDIHSFLYACCFHVKWVATINLTFKYFLIIFNRYHVPSIEVSFTVHFFSSHSTKIDAFVTFFYGQIYTILELSETIKSSQRCEIK